jgi:hypothetical protein
LGDLVAFLPRVVRTMSEDEVSFTLAYLGDVVDRRLERAVAAVDAAMRLQGGARTDMMGTARADYSAAHIVASLVDDRIYDCNEWPAFTVWAAELVRAVRP